MSERLLRRKDGSTVPIENRVNLIELGETSYYLAMTRDITERKVAERELQNREMHFRHMAEENSVMAEIGRIIESYLDISEVYNGLGRELRKLVPFDRIVISLANLEQDTPTNAYVSGWEIPGREAGHVFQMDSSLAGPVIKKGCSQAFHPSNEDELEGDFDILLPQFQAGLRSFLGVPLVAAGVTFGAIRFNSATPNAYTEEVVEMAERIAALVPPALENARL